MSLSSDLFDVMAMSMKDIFDMAYHGYTTSNTEDCDAEEIGSRLLTEEENEKLNIDSDEDQN